jgi:(R,R)-butanediol dehydrogenase/meso-butanediol dehydrogenase/diacetyl reductase
VLVEVAAVGICGSDVHYFEHGRIADFVVREPLVLGHEASGTIRALGSEVTDRTVGQRVAMEPQETCGRCEQCLSGRYNLCPDVSFFATPPVHGAFAQYVVLDSSRAHPVPDSLSDEAAALIEPLSVAHHAVARSGVKSGDTALVGGSGPIGLLTAAVLKGMGVTTIISELTQARKEKATSSGVADHVLDPSKEDVPARVRELTGGPRADAAFECAGVNAVLDTMLDAVRPGGVVVNVAIWGAPATVDMQKLVLKEIDLRGTIAYVRNHPAVIRMVQEGKVDLKPFITGRIALEDLVEQGFDTLINHKDTAVKVLVRP